MVDLGAGGLTHFVGIGGVGMSGLARLLLAQGYKVSGSDQKENRFTKDLEEAGAIVYHGHDAKNLAPEVSEIIVSTAIPPTNPEVMAGKERGLPITKRGQLLARLFNNKTGIAIAGAHGKTTTSAMVALVLHEAGLKPSAVIGGYVREFGGNALVGQGPYMVAEADESDGSFLRLKPQMALVTNIEADHLDYYNSFDRIINAFITFINNISSTGKAVLCTDNSQLAALASKVSTDVISYGFNGTPDYRVDNLEFYGIGSRASVYYHDEYLGKLTLKVPGRHNILNALGTFAVAHQLGIPFKIINNALGKFRGVGRRFEILWDEDTWVIDDYAHHPTEIKSTLEAASQLGARRIIAVFQPHRYTRTQHFYKEFGQAFHKADVVVINDIYAAGEAPIPGVSAELITREMSKAGHPEVYYLPTLDETLNFLKNNYINGDIILTLGAGDVWQVGVSLAQYLQSQQALPEVGT
ncbi:MAG: UDP-N-acetylmuramate--alanine ligase [Clostridia bacterium]|nr:UDP-N-acetylmuramate--alanine ligase [Clostridia bacterium]